MSYPSFANMTEAVLIAMSDEQLATFEEEAKAFDVASDADYQARCAKRDEMVRIAEQLWSGKDLKKVTVYLLKMPMRNPSAWSSRLRELRRKAAERRAQEAAKQQEAVKEAKRTERVVKAVLWLKERGWEAGRDFDVGDAIEAADDAAFHEEVARLKAENRMLGFAGDDTCDMAKMDPDVPCAGWDGESHRCACGNRRVSWSRGYGHGFEEPYVYAQAY